MDLNTLILSHIAICLNSFRELVQQCHHTLNQTSSASTILNQLKPPIMSERSIHIQKCLILIYSGKLFIVCSPNDGFIKLWYNFIETIAMLMKLENHSIISKPLHDLILVTSNMIRSKNITSRKVLLSMSYHWSLVLLHSIVENTSETKTTLLKSILTAYDFLLSVKEMQNASMAISEYYPTEIFYQYYPNLVYFNTCLSLESFIANQSLQNQRQCYQRLVLLRILSQSIATMKNSLLSRNYHQETLMQYVMNYHLREGVRSSSKPSLAMQILQLFLAFDKNMASNSRGVLDDSSSISSMTSAEDTSSDVSYASLKRLRSEEEDIDAEKKRPCPDQDLESLDVLSYAANIMVLLNQAVV